MTNKEKWLEKVQEYCDAHVYEVGINDGVPTSERWIKILSEKRYINFIDYYEEQLEFKTKKEETEFQKQFKEIWVNTMNEFLVQLKKTKDAELREEIRKSGIKRKDDTPSKDKKKKSKK